VKKILPTWFDYLEESFLKKVQFKMFCQSVKTSYTPAENVNKTLDNCLLLFFSVFNPHYTYTDLITHLAENDTSRNVAMSSNASASSGTRKTEGKCIPLIMCYHCQNHVSSW